MGEAVLQGSRRSSAQHLPQNQRQIAGRRLLLFLARPLPPTPLRLRNAGPHAQGLDLGQHVRTGIPFVGDNFFYLVDVHLELPFCRGRRNLLGYRLCRRRQCLLNRFGVPRRSPLATTLLAFVQLAAR